MTLNPEAAFLVRLHFRDHLGSTSLSSAYSPYYSDNTLSGNPIALDLGTGTLTLFPKEFEETWYSPYGERLSSSGNEVDARYTDHEYDQASGFNYMKGRYQIAVYAGKFNRPDPMRDWDWLNPESLNLYLYVMDDPVNKHDPSGLKINEANVKDDDLWNAYKAAILSIDHGREMWNKLESADAVFNIKFKKLKKEQFGLVDNYRLNENGALLSADINSDPVKFTWSKKATPPKTSGYEDAWGFENTIIYKVVIIAHKLGHGIFALNPKNARELVAK